MGNHYSAITDQLEALKKLLEQEQSTCLSLRFEVIHLQGEVKRAYARGREEERGDVVKYLEKELPTLHDTFQNHAVAHYLTKIESGAHLPQGEDTDTDKEERKCVYCDKELKGSFKGCGDGTGQRFCCVECYEVRFTKNEE